MQSILLTKDLAEWVIPRAGRVVLHVPQNPEMDGAVYIPDGVREYKITDTHQKAQVVKVGYGEFYEDGKKYPGVTQEDFKPGDWVVFRPLLMELNAPYILTDVRRVDARIDP